MFLRIADTMVMLILCENGLRGTLTGLKYGKCMFLRIPDTMLMPLLCEDESCVSFCRFVLVVEIS